MTYVIVHEKVQNHAKWLEGFNRDAFHRTGSRGGVIYQVEGNPNEHYIVYDWDDQAAKNFLALTKSPEMQKSISGCWCPRAGVHGLPNRDQIPTVANATRELGYSKSSIR